jgi:hypothetical protein
MKRLYRVFFRCELGQSRNQIRTIGPELGQRPLFLLIGVGLRLLLLLGDPLQISGHLSYRLDDRLDQHIRRKRLGQECNAAGGRYFAPDRFIVERRYEYGWIFVAVHGQLMHQFDAGNVAELNIGHEATRLAGRGRNEEGFR